MPTSEPSRTTKILFIENDETSFQVRKCMARALSSLPPIELFHARDASEALAIIEELKPDVIVLDDEVAEERELLIENLSSNHPPIVLRTDKKSNHLECITCIPKNESLDGIHQTLIMVTAIGVKASSDRNGLLH